MSGRLAGRRCLVTGGGRGIGRALAAAFAAEGARVAILDAGVSLAGAREDGGVAAEAADAIGAVALAVDVADADAVEAAVAGLGTVDVAVNAAGIMRRGSILDATADDLAATLAVHVGGAFNVTRALATRWSAAGRAGRVLNVGSDAGFLGAPDHVAYATAKAALLGLTLSAAQTLAPLGGTCNLVVPQAETRMTASIPPDQLPDAERWPTGEFDPANVAPAVVWLAGDEGAAVNGAVIGAFGFEVHRYALPARVRSLYSPGPWDADVLARRMRESLA